MSYQELMDLVRIAAESWGATSKRKQAQMSSRVHSSVQTPVLDSPHMSYHLALHRGGGVLFVFTGLHQSSFSSSWSLRTGSSVSSTSLLLLGPTLQPWPNVTFSTDPTRSCTLRLKLSKPGKANLIHIAVIPCLQLTQLWLCSPLACKHLSCTCTRTGVKHTQTHTPSCYHPGWTRQQTEQTQLCCGSLEWFAWSCQKLNLRSALLQFFPPQQFKMESRYHQPCSVCLYYTDLKWRRSISVAMH